MCEGKQPRAGFTGRLVFGPQAEQAGNEDAKGISIRLARDHPHDRFLPLPDLTLDDLDRRMDLVLAHG